MAVVDTSREYIATFSLQRKSFLAANKAVERTKCKVNDLVISADEKYVYFTPSKKKVVFSRDIATLKILHTKKGIDRYREHKINTMSICKLGKIVCSYLKSKLNMH